MANLTVQGSLDNANITDLASRLQELKGFGVLLAGLIPVERTRTVASSATHIHDIPGIITAVALGAVQKSIVLSADTPAAGEVGVTYDTNGLATLLFGDGVNTEYTVLQTQLPTGLAAIFAREV